MSEFVTDKRRITQKVLAEIKPDYTEHDLEQATYNWWKNKRENGGLGLSDLGLQHFVQADLEYYTLDITSSPRISLGDWVLRLSLDRKMPCPYYTILNNKPSGNKIMLFDSRITAAIILYGGVREYLQAQEPRPNASQIYLHP